MRRTKIVCTIGPACRELSIITKMVETGMDVARLNFSHGNHIDHSENIAVLRQASESVGSPLAILQDLCGPKMRLGEFTPFVLEKKARARIVATKTIEKPATDGLPIIPLPIPSLIAALQPNNILLLDDGKLEFKTLEVDTTANEAIIECVIGGEVKPRKGITARDVAYQVSSVTPKDLDDLRFGLSKGIDLVAVSFVRTAEDLNPIFQTMQEFGRFVPVIAKIEKSEALLNIDSIITKVHGIMVARGDLGVETPYDRVPIHQKQLIRLCNRLAKPVITATQMLESMMENPRPTRAEATDVANAILDGTDAIMLSGETAAGQYPLESLQTMVQIAETTEESLFSGSLQGYEDYQNRLSKPETVTEAVACAAASIAAEIKAKVIVCATTSGSTARAVSKYRPAIPILAATTSPDTYKQLSLVWGVIPQLMPNVTTTDEMIQFSSEIVETSGLVTSGDKIVLTAGVPVNHPGTTNMVKVDVIK